MSIPDVDRLLARSRNRLAGLDGDVLEFRLGAETRKKRKAALNLERVLNRVAIDIDYARESIAEYLLSEPVPEPGAAPSEEG